MSKSSACEVELEYPIQINGQDVIVKRYNNPSLEARVSDHSSLDFHSQSRLTSTTYRGKSFKRPNRRV